MFSKGREINTINIWSLKTMRKHAHLLSSNLDSGAQNQHTLGGSETYRENHDKDITRQYL
jgi:hypothetical protein